MRNFSEGFHAKARRTQRFALDEYMARNPLRLSAFARRFLQMSSRREAEKTQRKLKQIRMGTGTVECNSTRGRINFVNQHPVALNVTFKRILPFAVQGMIATFRWQRLLIDDHGRYCPEFTNIPAAFFHQLAFFLEEAGKYRGQHTSVFRIVLVKISPHFLGGTVSFGGDFPAHHGTAFLNSGDSFGIGDQSSAFGVAIWIAQRTIALIRVCLSWCKSKNCPSHRYFRGHVNNQSPAFRNVYGLRNGHKVNIA